MEELDEMDEPVTFNDPDEKLDRLEELCQLLTMQDAPATEWFKTLGESQADVDQLTTVGFMDMDEKAHLTAALLPQVLMVLHECILNLRWNEVLRVLHFIIHVPSGSSHTIWKVGNELLQMEKNERLVKQLFDQMKYLKDLDCKDVVLEYVFYLMSIDDSEAALSTIQEVIHRPGYKRCKTAKDYYVDKLMRAYTGLLWYIEWKNLVAQLDQDKQQTTQSSQGFHMTPVSSQAQTIEMRMNNCANKAILCFQELVGQPGVWDIFVNRHVELLMSQHKTNQALTVLQKSAELNPENPNAQKYLYKFYAQHFRGSDNVWKQLKVVADLVPSDSLVLKLCKKLQTDDLGLACRYLFKLLDYSCWQNILAPWKLMGLFLTDIFTTVPQVKSTRKIVKKCWKVRRSWWPAYHFTEHSLRQGPDESLVFSKAVVAGLLLESDNDFIATAKKFLPPTEQKRLMKILNKS